MKANDKEDRSQLVLTIELLTLLENNRGFIKSKDLADKFSLSQRSIRRIISDLRGLGYDIISVSGPYGGYKLNRAKTLFPVNMSPDDKRTFESIVNTIRASDQSNKQTALKLLDIIGYQTKLQSSINTEVYSTKKLLKSKKLEIDKFIVVLTKAIDKKQRVEIKYLSLNKTKADLKWQEFRPEQFQLFNGINYVKGYYNTESDSFRTLRLSRFEAIRLINKKYSFNDNFEVDNDKSAFSQAIYKAYQVKLKILKGNHDILDYKYGDNQKLTTYEDYHILEFDLAGDLIIKELVLSMGAFCEIIKPIKLRKVISEEIKQMQSKYND